MSEAQRTDVRCVQIACTMSAQCGDVKALLPSSKEPCRPQHSHLTNDDDGRVESAEVRGRRRGSGFSKVMASLRRLPIAENASAST